jgi:Peptidase M15.
MIMNPEKFRCRCCGKIIVDANLIDKLGLIEQALGIDLTINSGYRCLHHNAEVGGVEDSSHTLGKAADIGCTNSGYRFLLVSAFINGGFNRIKIKETYIHVDVDLSKPQNVIFF